MDTVGPGLLQQRHRSLVRTNADYHYDFNSHGSRRDGVLCTLYTVVAGQNIKIFRLKYSTQLIEKLLEPSF